MIKLTREQTEEAARHPEGVECQAEGVEKTFVILDAEILDRMRSALYQKDVHESISEGLADLQAGRMMSARDADAYIRDQCELPEQKDS